MQWGASAVPPVAAAAGSEAPTAASAPPVSWVSPPPPPREVAPGLVFATTGRRFVAYLIDNLLVFLLAIIGWIVLGILAGAFGSDALIQVGTALVLVAVTLAYFALGWRSQARATPGMRLLKLQVGNAFDGRVLTLEQAIRRWFAMGYPLALLAIVPALGAIGNLVDLVLALVLLITTVASPTKQGLHDRFANSAVVEPTGLGSGWIVGCVVILILIFVVLPILSVISLVFIGGQVSSILSTVGSPAP